jgi:uncharacterized glyoxalase superfamily protein PhnB
MQQVKSTIIPSLRYRNAPAAIEWLCSALGFTRHAVYEGPDNTIAHAQLTIGGGMIMLGSVSDNEFGRHMRQPGQAGGVTHAVYIVVADANAHYARAKAGGAEIVREIQDESYGGRGYACRDPEGYVWSVGTYDPWVTEG